MITFSRIGWLLFVIAGAFVYSSAQTSSSKAAAGEKEKGATARPTTPPVPTVIQSGALEMRSTDDETVAIFDQNVIVTATNLKITCDHLEVVASRIGDIKETVGTLDKFKSLVAVGRVRIIQGDREVTCGRAEVLPREETIILQESPVVIDHSGPYVFSGTTLKLLRGERKVFGDNIQFSGPAIDDLGYDKDKVPKLPAPLPTEAPKP